MSSQAELTCPLAGIWQDFFEIPNSNPRCKSNRCARYMSPARDRHAQSSPRPNQTLLPKQTRDKYSQPSYDSPKTELRGYYQRLQVAVNVADIFCRSLKDQRERLRISDPEAYRNEPGSCRGEGCATA